MIHRIINLFAFLLSGLFPRKKNRLVLGAWMGRRYADNPRYLFEYLCRTRPDLDLRWVGNTEALMHVPEELRDRFVSRGSMSSLWLILTAGRVYISHGYRDLAPYNLCRGAVVTYLGHGLTIKRMGAPPRPENGLAGLARKLFRWSNTFAHFAASSREHANKLLAEYAGNGVAPNRIICVGQPRTDPLLAPDREERSRRVRDAILDRQSLHASSRLVTYLPTFRDNGDVPFSFLSLNGHQTGVVQDVLQRHNAVLVEKMHFVDNVQRRTVEARNSGNINVLGTDFCFDTQDLLLATDVLITDYSGCYLDYLHLDRPVLHFAYDLKFYTTADRGMYYSLDAVAGGAVALEFDALIRYLDAYLADPSLDCERRRMLREWMLHYDSSISCEQLASDLGEQVCTHEGHFFNSGSKNVSDDIQSCTGKKRS